MLKLMESDNNNLSETKVVTEQKLKAEKPENGRVMNAPTNMVKIPILERFVAVDCEMVGVGKGGVTRL